LKAAESGTERRRRARRGCRGRKKEEENKVVIYVPREHERGGRSNTGVKKTLRRKDEVGLTKKGIKKKKTQNKIRLGQNRPWRSLGLKEHCVRNETPKGES